MKQIPYDSQPKFWFEDEVSFYHSTNQKVIVTGMAYTSFDPHEVPAWHYHIQATTFYGWFQAWVIESELILAHKNNPTLGHERYKFDRR